MSILYVVSTPIGNLEDITLRALKILREVDYLICENPSISKRILSHYSIKAPKILSLPYKNYRKLQKLVSLIYGKKSALVVDAGTPGVSDPGQELVRICRSFGFSIVPIPGPSALTAAISISGIRSNKFSFYGFLPKKEKDLLKIFNDFKNRKEVLIVYESPHRIIKTLSLFYKHFPNEKIFCAKELTKIYEETFWGRAEDILEWLKKKEKIRGEFVLIFDFS
jgi:16S rRNA (cytidine1402-2'-O)-methyltransferase